MSLKIIKAGLFDTIQDAGRYGFQHLGINPGGAMDRYAAGMANALTGNDIHAPVLELHFPASSFVFTKPALIAVTGADFSASINGCSIPLYQPVYVNADTTLVFRERMAGARAYLSVYGGFCNLSQWLGSYSTETRLAAGGFNGRALINKDILETTPIPSALPDSISFRVLNWKAADEKLYLKEQVHVLPGPEWPLLPANGQDDFLQNPFQIGLQSDRMGYQLEGIALERIHQEELVSSPVSFGTIQLLPNGKLIVLMAGHQTVGGYPRIAHVITSDQSILAQKNAGDIVRFRLTDMETAEDLFIQQYLHLQQVRQACLFKLAALAGRGFFFSRR